MIQRTLVPIYNAGEPDASVDHALWLTREVGGRVSFADPLTGRIEARIDYRAQGVRHAQNIALGNFDKHRKGLEIAFCEKGRNLYLFDAGGKLVWKRPVPAALLSKGDWDGDGFLLALRVVADDALEERPHLR